MTRERFNQWRQKWANWIVFAIILALALIFADPAIKVMGVIWGGITASLSVCGHRSQPDLARRNSSSQ